MICRDVEKKWNIEGVGATYFTMLVSVRWIEEDTAFSVWSVIREVDKERHRRRVINGFFNTSFVSLSAWASATTAAHVSIMQVWVGTMQQPCNYGVVHNLWQFYTQKKVSRQKRSLFHHFPSRITSLTFCKTNSTVIMWHPGFILLHMISDSMQKKTNTEIETIQVCSWWKHQQSNFFDR